MATSLTDLLSNAYNRSVDFAKQKATSIRNAYSGVRSGMAGEPALEPTGAQRVGQTIRGATLRGAEAVGTAAGNAQVAGQRAGEAIGGTAKRMMDAAHSAFSPSAPATGGATSPNVDPAQVQARVAQQEFQTRGAPKAAGSPEAQAFRASGAGNPPPPPPASGTGAPQAPKPGMLRSAGGKVAGVAKGLGVAGAALAAADAGMKAYEGQTPEQLTGTGGAAQGGATELYDTLTFGQGRKFAHGVQRSLGAVPSLRTPQDSGFPVRPGLVGVADRFAKGWREGDELEKRAVGQVPAATGGTAPQPAPAAVAADGPTPQPAVQARPDTAVPQTGTPAAQTGTQAQQVAIPAEGTGSIQRTTTGNTGQVQAVGGAASDSLVGGTAQSASLRNPSSGAPQPAGAPAGSQAQGGLRDVSVPVLPGRMGVNDLVRNKHDLKSAQLSLEARGQDVQDMNNQRQVAIRQYEIQHQLGKENEERVNAQIEQHAKAKMAPLSVGTLGSSGTAKAEYDAKVAQEVAATKNRFQNSIADRKDGRSIQTLKPAEMQQLRTLDKVRDRVMESRGGSFQTLRDLIGQKRFDSENLYSYHVTGATPSVQGGYVVHLGNGNQIHVKELAGGHFVLFGANEPVDADTMAMIRPAIAAAERGKK